jgi:beta-lactam-binding protein with PASTA domain
VLFELLTGRKPHTGDTPIQVAYAHVHADVPAPSRYPTAGPIPSYLDALVARATSRTASARPADARVLLTEVRRVQSALREGRKDDPELARDLRSAATATPSPQERADYEVTQLVPASVPSPPRVLEAPPPAPLPRPLPRSAPTPPEVDRISRQRDRQARRRRRGLVALLLVLLLTTAVAVTGWYLTTGRFTATPALATLSQAQAAEVAERANLDIGFTEEFSESVPRGAVIETDPSAGSKILKGGRIEASVSRGPERFAMPTVVGLSREAAETAVQRANLTLDKVSEKFSESVRDGVVISASKKPGASLRRDTKIDLVVSKGPAPIPIESYVGKKSGPAQSALRKSGFTVVVEQKHSDEVAKGLVLAQDPKSGAGERGDTVTLTESLGPVLVQVPYVRNMGVKAAREAMAGAGFRSRVKPVAVNHLGLGYVAYSDPPARSQAPKGSVITLYVV